MLIFNLADIVSSITLAINCLIKPFTMAGLAVLFLNHDFARLFDRPRGSQRGTTESFLGFIDITSIRLWLRHLST